jgi:DNA-binding NtrC family response regulator
MTQTDGAARVCTVDSAPRERVVQTSADARALRFGSRSPRLPARAQRSSYLVEIGENGLADFRVERAIRRLAEFALEYTGGCIEWAAAELAVDETTLRRWLKAWARDDERQQERPIVRLIERGGLDPCSHQELRG